MLNLVSFRLVKIGKLSNIKIFFISIQLDQVEEMVSILKNEILSIQKRYDYQGTKGDKVKINGEKERGGDSVFNILGGSHRLSMGPEIGFLKESNL